MTAKSCIMTAGHDTLFVGRLRLSVLNTFESFFASDVIGRLKAGAAGKRVQFFRKK